jgi:hypothetical protein
MICAEDSDVIRGGKWNIAGCRIMQCLQSIYRLLASSFDASAEEIQRLHNYLYAYDYCRNGFDFEETQAFAVLCTLCRIFIAVA